MYNPHFQRKHTRFKIQNLLFFVVLCAIVFSTISCKEVSSNSDYTLLSEYNPANMKQNNALIRMGVTNQTIYLFSDDSLYEVANNKLKEIQSFRCNSCKSYTFESVRSFFANGNTVGNGRACYLKLCMICESGMYYQRCGTAHDQVLYLYDPTSGTSTPVLQGEEMYPQYLSQDGTLYVSARNEYPLCYPINGTAAGEQQLAPESYTIAGKTYTVEESGSDTEVVCYDEANTKYVFDEEIPYGQKSLIPCENGLIVHNEGWGNILYYIDGTSNEVIELFTVDCAVSISTVNVYQDYAYLSFSRYKAGEFGIVGYKDDTVKGTYRINLNDYSVEKMSDDVYSGLFIFDDSGIFACDSKGNVYKLDFDCQRIAKLR